MVPFVCYRKIYLLILPAEIKQVIIWFNLKRTGTNSFLDNTDNRRNNVMELGIIQCYHYTGSRLRNCINDFLTVKFFQCAIFLNNFHGEQSSLP